MSHENSNKTPLAIPGNVVYNTPMRKGPYSFKQAVDLYYSQKEVAKLFGVTQQCISRWLVRVPSSQLMGIYQTFLEDGYILVPPHLSRPDLYYDYKHISELQT